MFLLKDFMWWWRTRKLYFRWSWCSCFKRIWYQSITPYADGATSPDGALIYNKFSLELRYPLTLKPSASIYGLAFLEAGKRIQQIFRLNPFQLKRSAGVGLRIFMPAFGLLGIDFGYGFDEDLKPQSVGQGPSGWQTTLHYWSTVLILMKIYNRVNANPFIFKSFSKLARYFL